MWYGEGQMRAGMGDGTRGVQGWGGVWVGKKCQMVQVYAGMGKKCRVGVGGGMGGQGGVQGWGGTGVSRYEEEVPDGAGAGTGGRRGLQGWGRGVRCMQA